MDGLRGFTRIVGAWLGAAVVLVVLSVGQDRLQESLTSSGYSQAYQSFLWRAFPQLVVTLAIVVVAALIHRDRSRPAAHLLAVFGVPAALLVFGAVGGFFACQADRVCQLPGVQLENAVMTLIGAGLGWFAADGVPIWRSRRRRRELAGLSA